MSDEPKGYAAMKHDVLEKIYGPDSPLHSKDRVFLYVYHQLCRDWRYVGAVSTRDIIKATGITNRRNLSTILSELEEEKMLLSHKSKTGRAWNPTVYALHPKRFGLDTLWTGTKNELVPKIEQENQRFELESEGKIIPITRAIKPVDKSSSGVDNSQSSNGGVASTESQGVASTESQGGGFQETPPKELNLADIFGILASKNPFKNPKHKEPSSKDLNFSNGSGSGTGEQQPRVSYPNEVQKLWLKETDGNETISNWYERKYGRQA